MNVENFGATLQLGWFGKALVGTVMAAFYFMFIPFMQKNFGISGYATVALWMVGSSIGILLWTDGFSIQEGKTSLPWIAMASVLVIGLVFGSLMNIAVTSSILTAPNPAYPSAILNANAVLIMVAAPLLWYFLPNLFSEVIFSWRGTGGIVAVIAGTYLISTA